jgi:hypothetical protein
VANPRPAVERQHPPDALLRLINPLMRSGGRDIEVTLRGQRPPAQALLIDDSREVAAVYGRLISEFGVKQAHRRLGLRFNVDRAPTESELREAIERSGLSIVRIYEQPSVR